MEQNGMGPLYERWVGGGGGWYRYLHGNRAERERWRTFFRIDILGRDVNPGLNCIHIGKNRKKDQCSPPYFLTYNFSCTVFFERFFFKE